MKDLQRKLVVLVSGLLLLAAAFVSYRAGERFESSLTQQRLGVETEIGRSVAVVVEKALAFGVPFDQLADTERFLEAVKLDNPGVDYIIITTLDGRLRYSTDLSQISNVAGLRGSLAAWNGRERTAHIGKYFNTATALNGKERQLGWLHLGERANIIEQLLRDIVFDILTVLVVAMLVTFELMRLLFAATFKTPMHAINEFFTRIASGDFRRTLAARSLRRNRPPQPSHQCHRRRAQHPCPGPVRGRSADAAGILVRSCGRTRHRARDRRREHPLVVLPPDLRGIAVALVLSDFRRAILRSGFRSAAARGHRHPDHGLHAGLGDHDAFCGHMVRSRRLSAAPSALAPP